MSAGVFPYEVMWERQDALERLDIRFFWGSYEIRVLRFHLTSFAPGKVIGFHKHAEFEFHFIPRGKGIVIMGEQEHALREGQLYVTGPGVVHYQEADAHEAMDELCLHVDVVRRDRPVSGNSAESGAYAWEDQEAEACISRLQAVPLYPAADAFQAMPRFLEAYLACSERQPGLYTTIKQCVIQILLRTVRAYDDATPGAELPVRDMKAYRYRLALEYMRANSSGSVTIEDVADKLRISARQLQRVFKEKNGGRSFSSVLEDIRLEGVCRRLTETDLTIDQIAALEGYANGSYLHAVFRKRFGITPSAYRLQQRHAGGKSVI
jgi:AraC-like DNA-binding protein/mannose-6-phosphate isomerase-like protein (cupin superfamily)